MPRSTLYLLQNSEGSFSGFFQSDALMISFLERLLSSLAATADSLSVELEIRSTGVHVVELGPVVVTTASIRENIKIFHFILKETHPAKSMATPKGLDMTPPSSSESPNWMARLETA